MLLVVAGFVLMQAAWLLTIPPFRGSDEFDHAYRAAAVARGEWVAGAPAGDDSGWLVEVPGSLVEAANAQCEELPDASPANCSPVEHTTDGNVLVGSTAAGYHPAFYWVVGTLALPFEGAGAAYAMRIASSVLCLLFLAASAWALGRLPGRWPLVGLVLAATPVLIYSTTIVAPNGLEMAAGMSMWASLLGFCHERDERAQRRLLWMAIASGITLGTLRLIGPLFILLILGTVALLRREALRDGIKRHSRTFLAGGALIGVSVAQFAWWTFGPYVLDSSADSPDGSEGIQTGDLVVWSLQTIAAFPYRNQLGPPIVYSIVGSLVLTLFILAVRRSVAHDRWVALVALAVTVALPILLTLATLEGRGVIWQGRYGLPYGVGFVLIAGYLLAESDERPIPWAMALPALGFLGVGLVACLINVKDDELSGNPASAGDPAWHAPSSVLLMALTMVAMLVFALAVSRRSNESV